MTIGIDNHNPFNIKGNVRDPWHGMTGLDQYGHAVFTDQVYSVRALVRILWKYWHKHGVNNLHEFAARYAPENDPNADNVPSDYAMFLSIRTGTRTDEPIELFSSDKTIKDGEFLLEFISAIAEYENFTGYQVCENDIISGMSYYIRDFV